MFIWSYFRLPETWNRSFHELDILFAQKVSARKFATTKVDLFDEHLQNTLAQKYSVSNPVTRDRPSFVPSVSAHIGDKVEQSQRRASVVNGEHPQRRPSIQVAVDDYIRRNSVNNV